MPAPQFRENFYDSLGQTSAYKSGSADSAGAVVVAAPGAGKSIRLKAFLFSMNNSAAADGTQISAWLADGTTAKCVLGAIGGTDISTSGLGREVNAHVVLPAKGITLTANTALNIDFDATEADCDYQVTVFYDVV